MKENGKILVLFLKRLEVAVVYEIPDSVLILKVVDAYKERDCILKRLDVIIHDFD